MIKHIMLNSKANGHNCTRQHKYSDHSQKSDNIQWLRLIINFKERKSLVFVILNH